MSRLKRSFDELAARGEPRGALDVFAGANNDTTTISPEPTRQRRPIAAFAGGFAVVLVVGALVAALLPDDPTRIPSTGGPGIETRDDMILLVGGTADGWEDAMVYGQLIVGEGGCLALRSEAFGTNHPVVWPSGTRFAAPDRRSIDVPGTGVIDLGAIVIASGGYLTLPSDDPRLPSVPADCLASGSQVAVVAPSSVRLEPTTTLYVESPALPPASSTPTPTVPQGAELQWFEFMPGSLHLAWRETADGAEMCWRTRAGEGCVDDDFRAPEAVVIPYRDTQVVVLTRPPLSGPAPEKVTLELANGQSEDVPVNDWYEGELLSGLSGRLEGEEVVSAVADNWPPVACVAPPTSQLDVSESDFEMRLTPSRVRPGEIVELFIGGQAGDLTGVPTFWQCWDGTEWINTHVGSKSGPANEHDPIVTRAEARMGWVALGLGVPETFRILVPDLPPGTYRLEDSAYPGTAWVIVTVED